MHEKPTTDFEGGRIRKEMKVPGKHEILKLKLDQADSVTSILNSLTADFFDKGNAINLSYMNFSKTLNVTPHQQLLTKLL